MLIRPGPVSNLERQRKFRERNPGYYRKYYRKIDYEQLRQNMIALEEKIAADEARLQTIDHQSGGINSASDCMV